MGREDGFTVADVSSGHFDDDKVRRLWRLTGESAAMCEAMTVHMAVVLASWRNGKRVTVEEAAPLWLTYCPETIANLQSAGLLDRSGRIPARSWTGWYGPAMARRSARVEAGRLGGLASGKRRSSSASSNATATLNPSGRQAGPSVLPSEPSVARPRTRRQGAADARPQSLGEALAGTPLGEAIAARKGGGA